MGRPPKTPPPPPKPPSHPVMEQTRKVLEQHMSLIENPLLEEFQSLLAEILHDDAAQTWEVFLELWQKNDSGPVGDEARARLMPLLREKLMTFYQTLIHVQQLHKRYSKQINKNREGIVQLKALIAAEHLG